MDRNYGNQFGSSYEELVALLAEGVDRNCEQAFAFQPLKQSPSSRRAWIEMLVLACLSRSMTSPSSRRAWIEISRASSLVSPKFVALLAEGVDRNILVVEAETKALGRPPRGGRG